MFAGAGVYRDGVFFALATSDGGIYLKCDAEIERRFRAAGSQPVHLRPGQRKITMSYWSLPNEALDDPDALKEWAELAYQAALRKPAKPKRSRKAKPKAAAVRKREIRQLGQTRGLSFRNAAFALTHPRRAGKARIAALGTIGILPDAHQSGGGAGGRRRQADEIPPAEGAASDRRGSR